MAGGTLDPRTWAKDPWLWAALMAGFAVRVLPLVVFPQFECLRDECIYRSIAMGIVEGHGLTTSNKGWLPSPGYPYLLAWLRMAFGSMQPVKAVQVLLSLASCGLLYGISLDLADRRAARIAAFLFALNPTIAWFTGTMWIETVYIFFLVAATCAMMAAWRSEKLGPAVLAGAMMGGAILFRGVATYLPPFWVLAAVYPDEGSPFALDAWVRSTRRRWKTAVVFLVTTVLAVAPYSMYASPRHGGFLVTDATVGHVLFLGNNDFPPLTFDYGIGMLTQPLYADYLATGRRPCRRDVPPVQSSKCEVQEAFAWIQQHPDKFVARVPLRMAQLLNPNSFLTRHVRWGYWPGFPWWAKELLVVGIIGLSSALTVLGTVAAWGRAKGPYAMMAVGTTVYTLFTIAIMYGMTRFRLPLEALWTVWLALLLAQPRATLDALRESSWRLAGALVTVPPLVALLSWYLPTGFPAFW